MNSKELLIKAKETAEKQLELAGQIEDAEYTIEAAKKGKVCFYVQGTGTVNIAGVTDPEKLEVIKDMAMVAIMNYRDDRTKELEGLLGIRKPVIINQEFEAAVQEMEHSSKAEPEPIQVEAVYPEMTVESVKELYHDKDMTLDQVAKVFGTNRTALYKFITKNNLRKEKKNKLDKQPEETERPSKA